MDIRILWPRLKIMKPYLPQSVFSKIESIFRKQSPTRVQLSEIAVLGKSVGLGKDEIIAAIDAPLSNQGIAVKGWKSIFIKLILISILIVVSTLLIWLVVDPNSFPTSTYVPGTDYGTIRPQDFSTQIATYST